MKHGSPLKVTNSSRQQREFTQDASERQNVSGAKPEQEKKEGKINSKSDWQILCPFVTWRLAQKRASVNGVYYWKREQACHCWFLAAVDKLSKAWAGRACSVNQRGAALFTNAPAASHDCYSPYWFAVFMCSPCRKCSGDRCSLFGRHNGPNNTSGDTAAHIKPTLAQRAAGPMLKSWETFIDWLFARSRLTSGCVLHPLRLNAVKSSRITQTLLHYT